MTGASRAGGAGVRLRAGPAACSPAGPWGRPPCDSAVRGAHLHSLGPGPRPHAAGTRGPQGRTGRGAPEAGRTGRCSWQDADLATPCGPVFRSPSRAAPVTPLLGTGPMVTSSGTGMYPQHLGGAPNNGKHPRACRSFVPNTGETDRVGQAHRAGGSRAPRRSRPPTHSTRTLQTGRAAARPWRCPPAQPTPRWQGPGPKGRWSLLPWPPRPTPGSHLEAARAPSSPVRSGGGKDSRHSLL